ncbi:MAG: type I secretion system permease/ATPase [Bdellovibrionales bacterium]|jgi:ATP-binding cassette subfamily C protein LapB|nr:type I secretion system permease/ATPase [Bdellovibrionales bacterium]
MVSDNDLHIKKQFHPAAGAGPKPAAAGGDSAAEAADSNWPLEAERLSLDDPLLECLAILAGSYGRRTTVAALSAGLPIHGDDMASPAAFVRAADRVSMTARMVRRPLKDLILSPSLPCIVVLKNNQACILSGRGKKGVLLVFPETPDVTTEISLGDLQMRYGGYAFFVRPRANLDSRAGPAQIETGRDWFWGAIWRHKKIYYEVMLAAVVINLLAVASPLFTMNVYDRVIPNSAFNTLWVLAFGVFVAYMFDFFLKILRAHFVDTAGRKADNLIGARVFEQMLAMKMAARPPSVGVHAANLKEFETLRDFFTSATIIAVIDFPFIIFFIFLIWLIAGPVAIVPAILVPLVLAVGISLQKPLDKVVKESMREGAYKSSLIFETLSGLETIKAQAAEGHMQRKWEELNEITSRTHVKARALSSFGVNVAGTAAGLCSVGMVVYGAYLIADGQMTMGALIASVILSGRAMAPLASVAAILTKFSQSKESLVRLNELMSSPVERPLGQTFISLPVMKGKLDFRDVVFRYPEQKTPALNNISFAVKPGEHVGIIGAVGSGKTTIERLILNLYQPESGSVQIDGVDVRQIDPADLRRNIGVVQQTPYLFFGTVRENITLGHESVPDAAVLRAAEMAGVMTFLRDSEAGLDTQVGERGENLSGGQRQAIAIARALLYNPPILLLDEPTASIDPGSERRLYGHLKELIKDRTILLVTHKSAVLGLVDKLILMDRGRIVAAGPRDEVIAKLQSGAFKAHAGQEGNQ